MKLSRRGLLHALAVLPTAIAVYRRLPKPTPHVLCGDGKTDDTLALQAWGRGDEVVRPDGSRVGSTLDGGAFLVRDTIHFSRRDGAIYNCHFRYEPEQARG